MRAGAAANFKPSPIRPEWILEGNPVARIELLSSSADGTAGTYFWDCTAGRFNWIYSIDETVYVLEGSVKLKFPSGAVQTLTVGDTVFFPAGSAAEWTVDSYIRKIAFLRVPLPGFLVSAKKAARRVKRLASGRKQSDDSAGLL